MGELGFAGYECIGSIKISLQIIAGQSIITNILLAVLIILKSLERIN